MGVRSDEENEEGEEGEEGEEAAEVEAGGETATGGILDSEQLD